MKLYRYLLTGYILALNTPTAAQAPDTIINKGIYQSYFSYAYKEPVFVTYKLYQGGGDCSRKGLRFSNDTRIETACNADYVGSGYDRGHLADAEDFANNCDNDAATFRYYNAVPQSKNLNRGIWKTWETRIRAESQSDSLFIIAGAYFSPASKRLAAGAAVPDTCFKVVYSLTTHALLHAFVFTNTDHAICEPVTLEAIKKRIPTLTTILYL